MSVNYTRINWEDSPSTQTPLNAENLNAMDSAIDDLAGAVNELDGVPGDVEELQTDVAGLKNDFTQLDETAAKIDGSYDTMTVGNAKQLASTVGIEDNAPYLFRTAGGANDIGDREVDKIVGGSLAWNQLMPNPSDWLVQAGNPTLITDATGGTLTVNTTSISAYEPAIRGTGSTNVSVVGHKYLIDFEFCTPDNVSDTNPSVYISAGAFPTDSLNGVSKTGWNKYSKIKSSTTAGVIISYIGLSNAGNVLTQGDRLQFRNVKVIDLTQMFGSTIADYIYSLEEATAGAGVAWFRHLFPKDYYAYNAGELMSVQTSEHKMVGFNQWDEVYENGGYSASTGEAVANSAYLRSKNFIPVVSGATYYRGIGYQSDFRVFYYDADKNYIDSVAMPSAGTFTIPSGIKYIKFHRNGATYANDICINLSWDGERDGEYEEYTEHVYPLDDSLTLRGIPKLDSANNLYYDGDTYESDGTVTRRYGIVDLGTLNWSADAIRPGVFYANITGKERSTMNTNFGLACIKYSNRYGAVTTDLDKYITDYPSYGETSVFFRDADYAGYTKAQVQEALSGVMLVYKLAEPTTETADPFQNPQIVDDFGTEEYVDAGVTASTPTRDVAIPVGHETVYQANLRAKLEMAPDSPGDGDGLYVVQQESGENTYVPLASTATIQDILTRLTALENA